MSDCSKLLEELFLSEIPPAPRFERASISNLPEPAQRYLSHSIAVGTPLATSIRLQMHGTIKLTDWLPFTAEQVITLDRGMIWSAKVKKGFLSISGYDRLLNGKGEMKWKLLGLIPVMSASGPDITRSVIGRVAAECIWLPSVLCSEGASWTSSDSSHAIARLDLYGKLAEVEFAIAPDGKLQALQLQRWGNPDSEEYRFESFGGFVEEERTFGGYTIPSRLRVGWYFGSDRFEKDGEGFRVEVDGAEFN